MLSHVPMAPLTYLSITASGLLVSVGQVELTGAAGVCPRCAAAGSCEACLQGCTCSALFAGGWTVGLPALLLATSRAIQGRVSSNCPAQVTSSRSGLQERLAEEPQVHADAVLGLAQLGVTWAISATRITDNKHHVADVVAGMFLGGMIATVFALRAIPRIRCAAYDYAG